MCSSLCKCVGCKNYEDVGDRSKSVNILSSSASSTPLDHRGEHGAASTSTTKARSNLTQINLNQLAKSATPATKEK